MRKVRLRKPCLECGDKNANAIKNSKSKFMKKKGGAPSIAKQNETIDSISTARKDIFLNAISNAAQEQMMNQAMMEAEQNFVPPGYNYGGVPTYNVGGSFGFAMNPQAQANQLMYANELANANANLGNTSWLGNFGNIDFGKSEQMNIEANNPEAKKWYKNYSKAYRQNERKQKRNVFNNAYGGTPNYFKNGGFPMYEPGGGTDVEETTNNINTKKPWNNFNFTYTGSDRVQKPRPNQGSGYGVIDFNNVDYDNINYGLNTPRSSHNSGRDTFFGVEEATDDETITTNESTNTTKKNKSNTKTKDNTQAIDDALKGKKETTTESTDTDEGTETNEERDLTGSIGASDINGTTNAGNTGNNEYIQGNWLKAKGFRGAPVYMPIPTGPGGGPGLTPGWDYEEIKRGPLGLGRRERRWSYNPQTGQNEPVTNQNQPTNNSSAGYDYDGDNVPDAGPIRLANSNGNNPFNIGSIRPTNSNEPINMLTDGTYDYSNMNVPMFDDGPPNMNPFNPNPWNRDLLSYGYGEDQTPIIPGKGPQAAGEYTDNNTPLDQASADASSSMEQVPVPDAPTDRTDAEAQEAYDQREAENNKAAMLDAEARLDADLAAEEYMKRGGVPNYFHGGVPHDPPPGFWDQLKYGFNSGLNSITPDANTLDKIAYGFNSAMPDANTLNLIKQGMKTAIPGGNKFKGGRGFEDFNMVYDDPTGVAAKAFTNNTWIDNNQKSMSPDAKAIAATARAKSLFDRQQIRNKLKTEEALNNAYGLRPNPGVYPRALNTITTISNSPDNQQYGGTVIQDLDQNQIDQILAMGGKIEYLD